MAKENEKDTIDWEAVESIVDRVLEEDAEMLESTYLGAEDEKSETK